MVIDGEREQGGQDHGGGTNGTQNARQKREQSRMAPAASLDAKKERNGVEWFPLAMSGPYLGTGEAAGVPTLRNT